MRNKQSKAQIQMQLNMCHDIYKQYSWLLNAYVSDYYVSEYWQQLPQSWRESLKNLKPEVLSNIIDSESTLTNFQLLPLSLLALRQTIRYLSIPRAQENRLDQLKPIHGLLFNDNVMRNEHFKNCFWKRIKLKKRHEIELIAKMCYKLANETQCHYIVDVGSGLGHLSRILCYMYGLRVCALEAQKCLCTEARKLDDFMENTMKNYFNISINQNLRVAHLNVKIKTDHNGSDILEAVKKAFGIDNDNIQFGIVGLHPCGNLGPTLLRLFKQSTQVKFLNIVGCCYMKLTTFGYPLSAYSQKNNYELDYSARELACHALEAYVAKLKNGEFDQLKVHAYRAALEKLITDRQPNMYHSQVNSVKCTNGLVFAEKATSNLDIKLSINEIESLQIKNYLDNWKDVVVFYSLRLMIAPLVENIILLDRLLYILESDYNCEITSLFNPQLSPRNQVLIAKK
ncbi:protein RRNAD1 isoform X2 [Photinus pyralis]|uniref:protein RRNAD1 isoform X2 n=1 Tax=Photinus pyralis TaxID=7054 RepID=UPI00126763AB|nr:protein RRNAD1 isoform X2 [Photinus pyralis]